jgi:hypothetical protein
MYKMDEKNSKIILLKYRAALLAVLGSIFALIVYYNASQNAFGVSSENKRVIETVSLAFFTGFFVSILFSIHSKLSILDSIKDATRDSISEILDKNQSITSQGLRGIYGQVPYNVMRPLIESGSNFYILQTYIPDITQIKYEIVKILEKGGLVHILLIDPESEMAAHRASELDGKPEDYISRGVKTNLDDLRDIAKNANYKGKLDVRLYKNIPSLCLYRIDDIIFIGFFTANTHAVMGSFIELNKNSQHSDFFMNHFNAIWKKSTQHNFK